jgi:hypothetical protein
MSQAQRATAFHCNGLSALHARRDHVLATVSYLLDLELLLSFRIATRTGFGVLQLRRIGHLDVGHGCEVCGGVAGLLGDIVVFLEGVAWCAIRLVLMISVEGGCEVGEEVMSQVVVETVSRRCLCM